MTISQFDLKSICNYSNNKTPGSVGQIVYIDMLSSEDDEYQRMIKQKNRELSIDALLDDKIDEYNEFKESTPSINTQTYNNISHSGTGVISPMVMSINAQARIFESYEKVWNEIVSFLNKNTQNKKSKGNGPLASLDVTLQGDFDVDSRKIITKVNMCSSIIAMDGRIGSGNTILCGSKPFDYIMRYQQQNGIIENTSSHTLGLKMNGYTFYHSDLIDDDKIIVCRGGKIDQSGLFLIDNSEDGKYFFEKSPNWDKQYCWFRII